MKTLTYLALVLFLGVGMNGNSAFAAKGKNVKKTVSEMKRTCKKEYPKELKGKSFQELADWVEKEEKGPNAEAFKKSKCYMAHEKWESASGKSNEGAEHEKF